MQQNVSSGSDFSPRQLVEHGKSTNSHVIPQKSGAPLSLKKKTCALDHSGVPQSSPRDTYIIPQGDKAVGGANHKHFHNIPHSGDPGSSNTAVRSGRHRIVSESSTSDEEATVQL